MAEPRGIVAPHPVWTRRDDALSRFQALVEQAVSELAQHPDAAEDAPAGSAAANA